MGMDFLGRRGGSFALNWTAMGHVMNMLHERGVVDLHAGPGPLPTTVRHEFLYPRPDGDPEEAAAYHWKSQTSPNPTLVPCYKFNSNDGWIVTPAECLVIADALDSFLLGQLPGVSALELLWLQRVGELASFNRRCAGEDGYEVW